MQQLEKKSNLDSAIEKYSMHKQTLQTLIENEMKTIFLIGSGSNGKTYLLNELKNMIVSNGYTSFNYYPIPAFFNKSKFFEYLNTEKNIICMLRDPFKTHNIKKPENAVVIDMNNVCFHFS